MFNRALALGAALGVLVLASAGARAQTATKIDEETIELLVGEQTTNPAENVDKYSEGAPAVVVGTEDDDGRILLRVSDRGVGVAPRDRERVFDRYYRCSTGARHDVKGFGLGLSYVKLVVEAHGGTVTLAGRPGGGTAVTVALPRDARAGEGEP